VSLTSTTMFSFLMTPILSSLNRRIFKVFSLRDQTALIFPTGAG
jgi:hypothetical protein